MGLHKDREPGSLLAAIMAGEDVLNNRWLRDELIAILNREIPRTPYHDGRRSKGALYCPNCDAFVGTEFNGTVDICTYCAECGQRLE